MEFITNCIMPIIIHSVASILRSGWVSVQESAVTC